MGIETDLNCLGFFGFGGGWGAAKGVTAADGFYCNECPLKTECWAKHKLRCAEIFPALTLEFEKMAAETQGGALFKRFTEKFGTVDPYSRVMGGNIHDGLSVAKNGHPIDRGPLATLPWPFKTH